MLFLFLFLTFARSLRGAPLDAPSDDLLYDIVPRNISVQLDDRGVYDILVSCFATIFTCTWSAVHPNIPAPTDCWWTRYKRQVVTMVFALLAPEAMTAWALRQRLAARKIVEEYNQDIATEHDSTGSQLDSWIGYFLHILRSLFQDRPLPPLLKKGDIPRWTLTHGFLLQMGGFVLCEDGRPKQVLTHSARSSDEVNIIWNIQHGIIDAPDIPEEDIQDRSKGDAISKTLIILQTTWFVVKCITRWSTRLPVTELEVVTLGFALLNAITYALWWHKPQNLGRAVYLPRKPQLLSRKPRFARKRPRTQGDKPATEGQPLNSAPESQKAEGQKARPTQNQKSGIAPPKPTEEEKKEIGEQQIKEVPNMYYPAQKSWLRKTLQRDFKSHSSTFILVKLIPQRCATALIRPLIKIAEYGGFDIIYMDDIRVPMFLSGYVDDSEVFIPTAGIGTFFGSVHLVSSYFIQFSSIEEKWLWRACASIITVGPIALGLWRYFYFSKWELVLRTCTICAVPLYIISRVVLLIHSLIALRDLTPTALQAVEWTAFIPHL
ncbi:hypothetical protein BDN70DRAFT_935332 [Pholiota conissans]|uniref:Uncharacterized protein n=1 Tax=Pholiota conissans TaxID=109636 RepID=A0A9P5YUX4_9AGAR|nr:hypothetical protein BDN70DRAFT_935332 [Pholiota conissans]